MNILVTGANGQLGNEMRIISKGSEDKYIFTDVNQVEGLETIYLDITDLDAIRKMVATNDVQVIVNCAAWTNVDACETDEKLAALAEKLNADAPKNLADAMREVGGLLVHISTDYVFGKEAYNTPCNPDQTGTPTGVYGTTKLHGEQNIIASGCDYVILRTAWLYSEFGKNFCKTMLNLTATKPQLKVVFDQCGTPTYAYDLATAIFAVLADYKACRVEASASCLRGTEASLTVNSADASLRSAAHSGKDAEPSLTVNSADGSLLSAAHSGKDAEARYPKTGIYHYSNEGVTSWYDFTRMIARIAGHKDCQILPCHSDEFPSPVKRPSYSVLDKTTFKETFGIQIPYWVDSLELCIKNLKG